MAYLRKTLIHNMIRTLHQSDKPTFATLLLMLLLRSVSPLICYCEGDGCPPHHINNTCIAPLTSKCFASLREEIHEATGHREIVETYGCLPADESTIMQCKGNLVPHRMRTTILCCDGEDLCNEQLQPELKPLTTLRPTVSSKDEVSSVTLAVVALVVVFLLGLIAMGVFLLYTYQKKKLGTGDRLRRLENQSLVNPLKLFTSGAAAKEYPAESMTSGSGSGLPLLVQSTVARQIDYVRTVGNGKFAEVWLAKFRDEDVAVKIFSTLNEASWESERELYQTCMLRHENILGFIAADIGGRGSCTQMLLITDFHSCSLFDFLRELKSPITAKNMVRMAHTVACGLSHLHAEIVGTNAKPSIVHRDLKSKNILVKVDGVTCVIADFGLAIKETTSKEMLLEKEKRQGTKRYMAPEVLDYSMQRHVFESYRLADIYSLSLVFWELARCVDTGGGVSEGYELPYYDMVGTDPDFEEMREVVCEHRSRPGICGSWRTQEPIAAYVAMMEECWRPTPSARLSALRVKTTLRKLGENISA